LLVASARNSRPWTTEEVQTLKREASRHTVAELATLLNRSEWAIRTKAAHERLVVKNPVARPNPRRHPMPWETERE
jgi:hypothetical protein